MLKLTDKEITLSQSAENKTLAIKAIAKQLTKNGLVTEGYQQGMLARELQNTTFLGNGIAIPHGTTETRNLVIKTGIVVHHFPQGVDWGEGNIVYIAIGIAAKSDEHLGILKQLTKVLSADGVEQQLKNVNSKGDIIKILNGDVQFEADFNNALIHLNFPATDMLQMTAIAGGLLKNNANVDSPFVAELVTKEVTHLGQGLWLTSSHKSVNRSAISIVTTSSPFEFNGAIVKGLIAVAACNDTHQGFLNIISKVIFNQQQATLLSVNEKELLNIFTPVDTTYSDKNTATFKINNIHGLHARPSAMLVATVKQFKSMIKVSNIDKKSKFVDAKSLMKVVGLGVKHGENLRFVAEGPDAEEALVAIGEAIASGLSEG